MSSQDDLVAPNVVRSSEDIESGQGSRRVNLVWEVTQAIIAISVTIAIIFTSIRGISNQELGNAFFLIIGFYFSRTNHASRSHRVTDYK